MGRAVRIPPLPEHLGDGPGRRLEGALCGTGGKLLAGMLLDFTASLFCSFYFPVREQI